MIGCVDHMFGNFFDNKLSVNQRSADNAHREIVELCPASHRPLLTKSCSRLIRLGPEPQSVGQTFKLPVVQWAAALLNPSEV